MKYHFKIHKEKDSYWADCVELKGCRSQAKTFPGILKSSEEELNIFLDEPENSALMPPELSARIKGKNIAEISVSPGIAFALMLKKERHKMGLTQSDVARKLGIRSLYIVGNIG